MGTNASNSARSGAGRQGRSRSAGALAGGPLSAAEQAVADRYTNLTAYLGTTEGKEAHALAEKMLPANATPRERGDLVTFAQRAGVHALRAADAAHPKQVGDMTLLTSFLNNGGDLRAETSIYDRNGGYVGSMNRRFDADGKSVYHSYFRLDKSGDPTKAVAERGRGYQMFKHQVDAYTKHGLTELTVDAAGGGGYNGGYTWGRFGYRAGPYEMLGLKQRFDGHLASLGVSAGQRNAIAERLVGSMRPGDIGRIVARLPDGKHAHVGKNFMSQQSWHGDFDLRKGSKDRAYMKAYPSVSRGIQASLGPAAAPP